MKKVYKILFIVVLALFCVLCSEASAKVKEDATLFTSDTYVIGSTKFDSGFIVTASRAATAGADEAIIQRDLYGNTEFKSSEIKTYYYCAIDNTWSEVKENGGGLRDLTENEVTQLEESLNIFFVNNIEKRIEITYDGVIDENSITPNAPISGKATIENNVISVPATWLGGFSFTSEGIEVNVKLANNNGEEIEELERPVINISAVAKIDSKGYATLQEAFEDAGEGKTITLIQNIELPTAVEVSKKVAIDLNGHNITMPKDTAGDGVFHVVTNGDLTINGEGIVDGTGNNDWNIAIFAEGGKVTINGGTYTNKNIGETDSDHFDVIYAKAGGSVEINAGRFEGKTPAWLLNLHDGTRNESEIVVKGGTFVGFNPANNAAEGKGTNFVAEGYKVTVSNNEYTVKELEEKDVAVVNAVAYEDLQTAVAVSEAKSVITLVKDIELPTAVEVSKKITIDLNGHNITMPEDTEGNGVFHIVTNGDLTINGEGIVDGTGNNDWNIVIFAEGGKVTINGGTYTNKNIGEIESDHFDVIYAKAGGKVEINAGRFEGKTPAWLLNLHDGTRNESEIVVKGGTFVGFNPADNKAEGEATSFVAEGYKVTASENEYTVKALEESDIAVSKGIAYKNLQTAVTEVPANSVITLVKDIELPTAVEVSKKITIDLNGHNITMPEDTEGNGVFHVVTNGDLTINGEGIVDGTGNNDWNIVIFAEGGKVTINGGTYTNKNIGETDSDHFDVIYAKAGGKVEINAGRFEGKTPAWLLNLHDGTRNESEIVVKGGTFVGFNPADNKAEGEATNFVAEGYKVTIENDIYTVSKAN